MSDPGCWRREWGLLALVALLSLPLFTPRLYAADEIKYLVHLRSMWFDGDVDYANDYEMFRQRDPVAHAWLVNLRDTVTATGRRLNDAPIGSALMWAPFYVVADAGVGLARAAGMPIERDGFGRPYIWAVCLASLFWGLSGVALVYRICRTEYDRWPAGTATLAIWFATPVVFYLYITPPMAHANSLFAVALFTWLWIRTRAHRTAAQWAALGAAAGLMVLVRELNWLMVTPLLVDEGLRFVRTMPERSREWARERLPRQLLFVGVLGLTVLPQFLVYRALHGTFGPTPFVVEKFSYPVHGLEVLFSGFHGLFSWSPVTLLGFVGLAWLGRRQPVVAVGFAAAFLLQVLVIGSYATWWGGASFGARRFINCMPLFAFGLAALLAAVEERRRRLAAVGVLALVAWNIGLAVQYSTGMIPRDEPVTMRTLVYNQVAIVPGRVVGVGWRFLTDRWSLVKTPPGES